MAILFSPGNVANVLAAHPAIAATLPAPAEEGRVSAAFPDALRSTDRELYRFLANTHYEHLMEALGIFERVFSAGCVFRDLVTTRSRQQFMSVTAEALVAENFLERGYDVTLIGRSERRSADLHVVGRGVDVAVEVYSPREWMEVDIWREALKDVINSADVLASYDASAHTVIALPTPAERYSPWDVQAALQRTHAEVLPAITRDALAAMESLKAFEATYMHPESALQTTFALSNVRAASAEGPARTGTVSTPGPSGYSPAGVFRTIVERAVRKAKRRQTLTKAAASRALLVNLMHSDIEYDLLHPVHHDEAAKALTELDPREYGLDLVAFYVRAQPKGIQHVYSVYENERLGEQQLLEMLGPMS